MKPYSPWDPHDGFYEHENGEWYRRIDVDPVLAEHESHAAKCVECGQWTCGYCGMHNSKGEWRCEKCHHGGHICGATELLAQKDAEISALKQALGDYPLGIIQRKDAEIERLNACYGVLENRIPKLHERISTLEAENVKLGRQINNPVTQRR
jgi:hypothetical protein